MKSAECCTEVELACTEMDEKPVSLNSADGAALQLPWLSYFITATQMIVSVKL